jgi:hypothetical protein
VVVVVVVGSPVGRLSSVVLDVGSGSFTVLGIRGSRVSGHEAD